MACVVCEVKGKCIYSFSDSLETQFPERMTVKGWGAYT